MSYLGREISRYTLLPGIIPRLRTMFTNGFSFLAGLMAVVYNILGLLPDTHPYLLQKNYGRFGVIQVIAEAGKNLKFSKGHIDQVFVYFTILFGFVLICIQIVLLAAAFFGSVAYAMPAFSPNIFTVTPTGHTPSQDMAFMVLDSVFGVMHTTSGLGFFESCISDTGTPCINSEGENIPSPTAFPMPMHLALHQMLYFYSSGIAFISFFVILYFVVTVVGETVASGTPFGRRFSKAWFAPRLIVFFVLIAPMTITGTNAGINFAQWITFSIAKYGSNMATNAWLGYVDSAGAADQLPNYLGQDLKFVGRPSVPEIGHLTQFLYLVRMCMVAEKIMHNRDIRGYFVREHQAEAPGGGTTVTLHTGTTVSFDTMGLPSSDDYMEFFDAGMTVPYFEDVVVFSRYATPVLRFGEHDTQKFPKEWGNVEPTCGELQFELVSLDPYVIGDDATGTPGIQDNYMQTIYEFFLPFYNPVAENTIYCMLEAVLPLDQQSNCVNQTYTVGGAPSGFDLVDDSLTPVSSPTKWLTAETARLTIQRFNDQNSRWVNGEDLDWASWTYDSGRDIIRQAQNAVDSSTYENNFLMTAEMRSRGWAGAALWFNQVSEVNGTLFSAVQNLPKPFKYPMVMEEVAQYHVTHDPNPSFSDRYNPRLQNGKLVTLTRPGDQYQASALYNAYQVWNTSAVQETVYTSQTGNAIIDVINMILGTSGLFDMVKNANVHPMAQLTGLGKAMVDASIRNMFAGIVGQGIGSLLSDNFVGRIAGLAGDFAFKFGTIGISIGFILYYVLPFMPFIYFFFAFSGWIKSIFEAVVAMPLWALAHIRIDGQGLPGPLATNGYFLLFEIFLRPTLIIFGFILSFTLFAALVSVLNAVYTNLIYAIGGGDMYGELFRVGVNTATEDLAAGLRPNGTLSKNAGPLDEFFYTAIYAMIVYMIGLSCFKMVDTIPNSIIRWMGATVSTFQENAGDPASQLSGKMYRSIRMGNVQIQSLLKGGSGKDVTDELIKNQILNK